jgi:hypothetical protein
LSETIYCQRTEFFQFVRSLNYRLKGVIWKYE